MTKVKLSDGTIINASVVELEKGVLKIVTSERTTEELSELFSDKEKTNKIVFLTESGIESGFKIGFTSFAGIIYTAEGEKIIEMFQPADVTEERLSAAEGKVNLAFDGTKLLSETMNALLGFGEGDSNE